MLHGELSVHFPSQAQIAHQEKLYRQARAKLEAEIAIDYQQLVDWLRDVKNRSNSSYGIVEEINNCFHREDKELNESLDYYEGRRDDIRAINDALGGKGVNALALRSVANSESASPVIKTMGILMMLLAIGVSATLGVIFLTPLAIAFGVLGVLGGYAMYSCGATKVSTEKSTLFNSLKESISPTPSPKSYPSDGLLMSFEEERLLYMLSY